MSFNLSYPDYLPGQADISDILVLDTFLDRWGRLGVDSLPHTIQSLCPISPAFVDRADRLQPYGFFAVLYGADRDGLLALGGIRSQSAEDIGIPLDIASYVIYERIGLFRHGNTRFYEIRLFFAYDQLAGPPDYFELGIQCSHPTLGTLTSRTEDFTEGTYEKTFLVDFNAPFIDLKVWCSGGLIMTGLEIVAEPSGRR